MEGLRHQLSQGAGGWSVEPGDRFTYYKLVDSVLPQTAGRGGHEKDFFDGIDTSLPGLAGRLAGKKQAGPDLRAQLMKCRAESRRRKRRGARCGRRGGAAAGGLE